MLFNSYDFALYFLPAALVGYFALGRYISTYFAAAYLALASVVFYSYWNPRFVPLLVASITFNFIVGRIITSTKRQNPGESTNVALAVGISVNLLLLAYYKYAGFFAGNVAGLLGMTPPTITMLLPLGISFFTFTQIAYLVDCKVTDVKEESFAHYVLFVSYFPHLIAGPLLHHKEMMPQFRSDATYRPQIGHLSIGLLFFAIGLFKKVVLADGIEPHATALFDGHGPTTQSFATIGVLAYTLQLYFDFSGYSDMAIGLSRMFGIKLPFNFDSPYKARSIIEFWRRWHMTLSRFLRDYLYIPLGGSRSGKYHRYLNLVITMVLGGLWHGAAWTFVIWGALHGGFLLINHFWRNHFVSRMPNVMTPPVKQLESFFSWLMTFVAVAIAWVFFRARDIQSATTILATLVGAQTTAESSTYQDVNAAIWVAALGAIVMLAPNSQQIAECVEQLGEKVRNRKPDRLPLLFGALFGFLGALVTFLLIINGSHKPTEFIYYNF